MLLQKLYVRIWLAVVLAVAVLTLLVGWVWRMTTEPPLREVVVRNASGEIIGNGHARRMRRPNATLTSNTAADNKPNDEAGINASAGANTTTNTTGNTTANMTAQGNANPNQSFQLGEGPQFTVHMQDGQTMHLHLPRPAPGMPRLPFGFFWMLGLVAVAVALATYPIVRRLTRRLEVLQHRVERWGDGDLSARVPVTGGDEVGFLASRFNHAAQQIETLVNARDALLASQQSLLANASHELRSPLTRIRMGLEMLGGVPGSAAKTEIARNITELDQLIEEILLASRLDAREADMGTVEPVDLVGLAAEECARTSAQLEVSSSSLLVPGIAKLLRRAVRNLLENAKRHASTEVTVKLSQDAHHAIIQVCDQGPGVPDALQSRIFEPFYRLPGASEVEGGVGLGLALVKSIAQRHGGSASCSNRAEGGACFQICLPLSRCTH